ncbi:MAG: hypothetical protein H0V01_15800 [Bacteroidetes bacterium]|nr:hypothetical protein [Bacteroidota bacterium]HET6244240.1 hypothetical protein [Bacteroidia bacterium]
MNSDKHIIFNEDSDCISEQAMYGYLDNTLSTSQMHVIEKHLLDCSMCEDALDGLSLLKNREKIAETRTRIDLIINPKKSNKTRVYTLWDVHKAKFAIAASVLFIIGLSGIITLINREQDKKIIVENIKSELVVDSTNNKIEQPAALKDEKVNSMVPPSSNRAESIAYKDEKKEENHKHGEETTISVAEEKTKSNFMDDVTLATIDKVQVADASIPLSENEKSAAPIEQEIAQVYESKNIKTKSLEESTPLKRNELSSQSDKAKTSSSSPALNSGTSSEDFTKKETNTNPDFNQGKQFFLKEDYPSAISSFEKYFVNNADNPQANLYCAISYLKVGKSDKALPLLETVLKNGNSQYIEQTNYYKSMAFINLNRKIDAKALLEKIVSQNGEYKKKAENLLKDLE